MKRICLAVLLSAFAAGAFAQNIGGVEAKVVRTESTSAPALQGYTIQWYRKYMGSKNKKKPNPAVISKSTPELFPVTESNVTDIMKPLHDNAIAVGFAEIISPRGTKYYPAAGCSFDVVDGSASGVYENVKLRLLSHTYGPEHKRHEFRCEKR